MHSAASDIVQDNYEPVLDAEQTANDTIEEDPEPAVDADMPAKHSEPDSDKSQSYWGTFLFMYLLNYTLYMFSFIIFQFINNLYIGPEMSYHQFTCKFAYLRWRLYN